MLKSNFELFVAWRYLRSRGRRGGLYAMGNGVLLVALAVVCFLVARHWNNLSAFEMTDRQIWWRGTLQITGLVAVAAGVLVFVFGSFLALQSIFSTISTFGVFLGTGALVIALSVMGGFEADLRRKILGSNAHVLITKDDGAFTEYRDIEKKVDGLCAGRGVCITGHTPYLSSEVSIAANSNYGNVLIKGIDPHTVGNVTDLTTNIAAGSLDELWPLGPDGKPLPGERPAQAPERGKPGHPSVDDDDEPKTFDKAAPAGTDDEEPIDFSHGGPAPTLAPTPPPLHPSPRPLKPDPRVAGLDGLLAGKELAKNLHLYDGEEVEVISPVGQDSPTGPIPRVRPFRIAGVFFSGMYEYDAKFVYVTIPALQQFLALGDEVTGVEIKISDSDQTQVVVDEIARRIGPAYRVQDWKELNKSLFSALKLEQIAMFLVLSIIILVASFSIISNLIMVVVEKAREIATLKSMGASDGAIMRIFIAEGLYIGILGTLFGLAVGITACLVIKHYGIPLNSDVYYIDRLPVAMSVPAIVAVAFAGIGISVIATIYPAYVGARMRPIDGLRQ